MDKKRVVNKNCNECKKRISMKEGAWVLIGNYNRPSKPDHEAYFHFPCFVDYFNEKVREKAFGLADQQAQIVGLINNPELQKLANNIISGALNDKEGKQMSSKKKVPQKKVATKQNNQRGNNGSKKAATKRKS